MCFLDIWIFIFFSGWNFWQICRFFPSCYAKPTGSETRSLKIDLKIFVATRWSNRKYNKYSTSASHYLYNWSFTEIGAEKLKKKLSKVAPRYKNYFCSALGSWRHLNRPKTQFFLKMLSSATLRRYKNIYSQSKALAFPKISCQSDDDKWSKFFLTSISLSLLSEIHL